MKRVYKFWVRCPNCGNVFRANFYSDFKNKTKKCPICNKSFIVYSTKRKINRIVDYVKEVGKNPNNRFRFRGD